VAVVAVVVALLGAGIAGGIRAARHGNATTAAQATQRAGVAASTPKPSAIATSGLTTPVGTASHASPPATERTAARPTAPAPWLQVHLGASCVVTGGRQSITVQSRPGYVVGYNTTYSDGKQGSAYGGAGYSPVNSDGSYRSTWVVSPNTPLGAVSVAVGTQRGKEPPVTAQATFTIATSC
jgi:hypothetical protein